MKLAKGRQMNPTHHKK